MSRAILVIGATGRVGSELVKLLAESGEAVRAATRNPSAAASKFHKSVDVVEFDYDRPETIPPALAGVTKVFLTVRPGDNHSDAAAKPLVDAAKRANVERIVDLTAMGAETDDTFMLRILEKYIETSGIPYTHLRPNWFMQNFNSGPMYADIKSTGALHLPAADATVSFIDTRDIAAAGFAVLTGAHHSGKAYTLTGQESLSHQQVVEKLSRAAGRAISYVPLSEAIAREGLTKRGFPPELVERWTDFYRKVRQGLSSPVSTDTQLLLGRPPILFDQYAEDHAAAWQ